MNKNETIKETYKQTKERRKNLRTVVYTLKIDKSHLSDVKINQVDKLFIEAKWLYNFLLSSNDIFNQNTTTIKTVKVKLKDDTFEDRTLEVIGSQIKQEILQQLKQNIITLSKSKKTGKKIGRLKFKSRLSTIKLKQPKLTWRLKKNYLSIQGIKGALKVQGIEQLKNVVEFGEAKFCKKGNDYWFKVTCYELPKTKKTTRTKDLGLDFGIETTVTTSDGEKFNCKIKQPKVVKLLNRGVHRKKKHSKNRVKQSLKYEKAHLKNCNRKKDIRNKIVSYLGNNFNNIFMQNEQVASWQKGKFGKQINESAVGGIIVDLKKNSTTPLVDKWFASTQLCNKCHYKNKLELKDRIFNCCNCKHTEDRDTNAAKNILVEGQSLVRNAKDSKTPVETRSSTRSNSSKNLSVKQEANPF